MQKIEIKVINESGNDMPEYKTEQSAGMDLRASLGMPMTIMPGRRFLVGTGLKIALPVGYEAQVRPRSGLALKHGVTVLNTPGTIDSDYREEIKVLLINLGEAPFTIYNGDRIAQMVIAEHAKATLTPVENFSDGCTHGGGWGHSGIK